MDGTRRRVVGRFSDFLCRLRNVDLAAFVRTPRHLPCYSAFVSRAQRSTTCALQNRDPIVARLQWVPHLRRTASALRRVRDTRAPA
jgi:hypothetical protein